MANTILSTQGITVMKKDMAHALFAAIFIKIPGQETLYNIVMIRIWVKKG